MNGIFDSLTRAVAKSIGMYEMKDYEACMDELEKADKEIRELKRMVFFANRTSGLPTGEKK